MALTRPKYSQIYDTDWKQSVRLATTADVGNLFLANTQPNSIDSVSLNIYDRILVKDQTRPFENGIYTVRSVGTGSNGWWTRTLDAADSSFVTSGLSVVVSEGSTNNGREYRLTTPDPITLGSTHLSFLYIAAQPAGANTQVQFNDMNIMSGSPGFTFNKTSNLVTITGNLTVSSIGNIGNLITANIYSATLGSGNVNLNLYSTGAGQIYVRQSTGGAYGLNLGQDISTSGSSTRLFFLGSSGHTTIYNSGGTLFFNTSASPGTSSGFPQVKIAPTGTAVNWLQLTGSATGNAVPITVGGTDTNIDLALTPKAGNIIVSGNILPSANITYDLGSPTQKFRSAYFSGNTIYIGGQSISVDPTGTWTFTSQGANINMGSTAAFDPPSANIAANLTEGGAIIAGGSPGITGYTLQSTGTGIQWSAPSAGTVINSGTSNVSILSSSGDIVTTVGGTIVARASSTAFSVNGNLTVNGNLFVNGNTTTINANNLSINDSLIYLADDNPADTLDIGFVSAFTNPDYQHTGFVRDATDGVWKLFANVVAEPTTTVNFTNATYSNILVGNILAQDIIATSFTGNGAALTGLPAGYSNVNATTFFASGTASGYINTTANLSAAAINAGTSVIGGVTFASGSIYRNGGETNIIGGGSQSTRPLLRLSNGSSSGPGFVLYGGAPSTNAPAVSANVSLIDAGSGNVTIRSTYDTTVVGNLNPSSNNAFSLGNITNQWNTIYGKATTAQYADLAENYTADQYYEPGTVLVFGGQAEVMQSHSSHDTRIAGVVSTNPAYLMNSTLSGVSVALTGRVPCQVLGPVEKGDRVVSSHIAGVAQALDPLQYQPGCVIGKALEDHPESTVKTIEVVVGRV